MKKLTLQQQLGIIEGLTVIYQDGSKTHEQAEIVIDRIYKVAHLNGTCQNEHLDYHKEGFEWIEELQKHKICDVNRRLKCVE